MTIVYGLIGLGIIVLVHELGHFTAAHICGVDVESFSIGMGPVLLRKKVAKTEYRISLLPLGGYCGLKGEHAFQEAIENNLDTIQKEKGSFYGGSPILRIIIAFAGPFFNFLFAIIALSIVAGVGYSYYTSSNKIILLDEVDTTPPTIAYQAGLKTGDTILSINGKKTPHFSDISEIISFNAKKTLSFEVMRNNTQQNISITPALNKETGAGYIGIVNWITPIVDSTEPESGAFKAGLQSGDLIISIDNQAVHNTIDVQKQLSQKKEILITWSRSGKIMNSPLPLTDGKAGIIFKVDKIHSPKYNFIQAMGHGILDTFSMLNITIKSISLLFKGIDFTKAVSGPVRITVMLGQTTKEGFSSGFATGIVTICNFLAIISISLFLMNLLPIPILDGGLILFAFIELFRGKEIKPKILYKIQYIGIAFIAFIFIFALLGDIRFLINGS